MLRLLDDPRKFGGDWLLPSVTRDDPAFGDNVYWRGRVWPPLNFLTYHGLKRYGFAAAAGRLAENSVRLFMGEWRNGRCGENFSAVTGEVCDQPDTDPYYSWGALMPALGVAEVMDVTPWGGWEITHGDDGTLGPVLVPGGRATAETGAGILTLSLNGRPVLRTSLKGRFRNLAFGRGAVRLTLPARADDGAAWIEFPGYAGREPVVARCAGQALPAQAIADARVTIPAGSEPAALELVWAEAEDIA
jgi:putative isomerase